MQWAESYWKFRLEQNMQYLFVTDLTELPETRKKYNSIYKALFKALGKQESVWYEDSPYCLRHVGIQRWIQVYGFIAVPMLQSIGFPRAKTLFDHYAGITADDFLRAERMLSIQVIQGRLSLQE